MIVFIVHELRVIALEPKGNTPIAADINSPRTGSMTFQFVKPYPGKIHILGLPCCMEPAKYQTEPFCMRGLDSCNTSGLEEAPEDLMLETPSHR